MFVPNGSPVKTVISTRPQINRSRPKPLPPVHSTHSTGKSTQTTAINVKPSALPPIDDHKKTSTHLPIIFVLSSTGSTKLCSRLLERYDHIVYISINDAANIDDDVQINSQQAEHRYDCVKRLVEQRRSNARGFLVAGDLNEKSFAKKWQEKLGRIDQVIILTSEQAPTSNRNAQVLQIDLNNDFDDILAVTIRTLDPIFPQDAFANERSRTIDTKPKDLNLPIFFCIDNHRIVSKDTTSPIARTSERLSVDEEFDLVNDDEQEEINNSFIKTLCERLAQQFSFKHIHYGDFDKTFLTFDQLKACFIESMSNVSGFIVDHFPTSLNDLENFRKEIGPCSALIYIGEHRTGTRNGELNIIVEQFKKNDRAIFVDCRMEVDEIYEDLKTDLLNFM